MKRNISIACLALWIVLFASACSRGDVTCYCNNGSTKYQNYSLGKRIGSQEALARCSEIENRNDWDTCLVIQPK